MDQLARWTFQPRDWPEVELFAHVELELAVQVRHFGSARTICTIPVFR
ncbi:hypothetical protein [Nonomuraea sp. SBT364]|nr:hypothetical protein [Nonomuraea sp. SBT364]